MRFSLRHLLAFVTFFALSLGTGIPGTHLISDGCWRVIAIQEEENGAMWSGEDPETGEPAGGGGMDYLITVRDGLRTKVVNLGDTNAVWEHQVPPIGSYVVLEESKTDTFGTLPVTVIEHQPRYMIVLGVISAVFASAVLMCFFVGVDRWGRPANHCTVAK